MGIKILFLCTGNSCRSQMAEGWARHLKSDVVSVWSAGTEKHGLNPLAVKVMAEVGIDISAYRSKLIDELPDQDFDYVITVCDKAHEACPFFTSKARIIHEGFADPPVLAMKASSEEEALSSYRRVRDEIKALVERFPATFPE